MLNLFIDIISYYYFYSLYIMSYKLLIAYLKYPPKSEIKNIFYFGGYIVNPCCIQQMYDRQSIKQLPNLLNSGFILFLQSQHLFTSKFCNSGQYIISTSIITKKIIYSCVRLQVFLIRLFSIQKDRGSEINKIKMQIITYHNILWFYVRVGYLACFMHLIQLLQQLAKAKFKNKIVAFIIFVNLILFIYQIQAFQTRIYVQNALFIQILLFQEFIFNKWQCYLSILLLNIIQNINFNLQFIFKLIRTHLLVFFIRFQNYKLLTIIRNISFNRNTICSNFTVIQFLYSLLFFFLINVIINIEIA
ncbi:transmembrane protein, putative (macronuclear) [Tetrahymena thermophila SB210]|uniref:Transmembrane protein, putative n=1 Tax=Tetrahymena thermophila (strain SB210) TaxID=312017 RepID=W7X364_TETTS|nr:transmembrane protein, putative [Tetrahymena thermophila SB210]EWS71882.1 transmembrane protein, putative [Tetrahymena thermophila SB210]|eukprot:XP_012655586.1 transmembrane protein, putative [Tetrahymena thermophila SB210]